MLFQKCLQFQEDTSVTISDQLISQLSAKKKLSIKQSSRWQDEQGSETGSYGNTLKPQISGIQDSCEKIGLVCECSTKLKSVSSVI